MSDFQEIFSAALDVIRGCHVESLLIGGFVVNHYGYSRQTADIDFMMALSDVDGMVKAMRNAGFTSYAVYPNVLFFKKPDSAVRIDCLKVGAETLAKLMSAATTATILGRDVKIPSLLDLLAMKFHSLSQSTIHREKDMMDIVSLSMIHRLDPETALRPLAQKFASEEIYQDVYARIQSISPLEPNV